MLVDRVVGGDHLEHSLERHRGEAQAAVHARAQHRLARGHFPAAVAADQQQREPGLGLVVQVAQVLDAFAGQPLGLVDDQQSLAAGEQLDQPLGEIEAVCAPGVAARQLPVERARDVQHRRAAGELHPRRGDLQAVEPELGGERLAGPGRAVQRSHRAGGEQVTDRPVAEQQLARLDHARAGQPQVVAAAHRPRSSASSASGRLTASSRRNSRSAARPGSGP